jgi:hypothetical protein
MRRLCPLPGGKSVPLVPTSVSLPPLMRKLRFFASAACLLATVTLTAFAQPKVEEVVLGPAGKTLGISVSRRGLHVATLLEKGSQQVMSIDGVEGPPFTLVQQIPSASDGSRVAFSADGKRHTYAARMRDDWVIILDGKEVARGKLPQGGEVGGLAAVGPGFSPGGKRFFYSTQDKTGVSKMFVDGAEVGAFHGIEAPIFSLDETRYAFYGTMVDGRTKVLVVDGKPTKIPGQEPQFSPDGKAILTIERRPTEAQLFINGAPGARAKHIQSVHMSPAGLNLMVLGTVSPVGAYLGIGGKKLEGSDCQRIQSVTFSPDGKRYAALCDNGAVKFMFIDGKRGPEYMNIREFKFSDDSSKAVYLANTSKTFVVVNNEESDGYPTIQDYVIGGGGKSVGFIGYDPTTFKSHVVINGKATPFDSPGTLAFSPDGSRYSFGAGRGNFGTLHVDGVEQKGVGVFNAGGVSSHNSFSPDNKYSLHLGIVDGNTSVQGLVVNGKMVLQELSYLERPPMYTADGQHAYFFGSRRSGGRFFWVDGQPVAEYSTTLVSQHIKDAIELSADGVLTFIAKHNEDIKRYRVTPAATTSITSMVADVEAAAAKKIADVAAKKKADEEDAAAKKKKADEDRAAATAKAKADADARAKAIADANAKRKADAEKAAAARKKAADDAAAARAKQKK